MPADFPTFIGAMESVATQRGISLDESFKKSVADYSRLVAESTRPELVGLSPRVRNLVLAVVGDRAISLAYAARSRVATAAYFKRALEEYKGPTPPPWDTCEYAAIQIARAPPTYEAQLTESLRRLL